MLTANLIDAIEEYDGDLALRRVAKSTRVKYGQHLRAFSDAVGNDRLPGSISTHEIKMHLARWGRQWEEDAKRNPSGEPLSAASIRNRICSRLLLRLPSG